MVQANREWLGQRLNASFVGAGLARRMEKEKTRAEGAEATPSGEERSFALSLSSETPIQHWFGFLTLKHESGCVRLERFEQGASWLFNHDAKMLLGGISAPRLEDGFLRVTAELGETGCAQDYGPEIRARRLKSSSLGFLVHGIAPGGDGTAANPFVATDWEPVEGSSVSVPADYSVGLDRSAQATPETPAGTRTELPIMSTPITTPASVTPPANQAFMSNAEQLRALGDHFETTIEGARALADEFALSGRSEAELRTALLERLRSHAVTPVPQPHIDLSQRDARRYSVCRAILAQVDARRGVSRRKEDGLEWEISDALTQSLERSAEANNVRMELRGGMVMPTNLPLFFDNLRGLRRNGWATASPELRQLLKRAGLDTATANTGAELVPTEPQQFIEFLYNRSAVMAMGATMLSGLRGVYPFVKQTGAAAAYWVGENPASDVTESALATGEFELSPKTLMATTSYSRQLLRQATPAIDTLVQMDLARVMALKWDRTAIHGAGNALDFKGIYYLANVKTVAFGGNITYGKIVDMETSIETSNADVSTMGYLTTIGVKGTAKKTLEFSASGAKPIWTGTAAEGEMNGYRAMASNQVSSTMSTLASTGGTSHGIVMGCFDQLLCGEWGVIEYIGDEITKARRAMIVLTAFQMADMNARHDESFCVGTGLSN